MAFVRRFRRAALCAVCALLPGCVIAPSGWDARTNGGRYDPGPDDPYKTGQYGVEDLRSGSQNAWALFLGGPD